MSNQGILVTEISDHFLTFHINWNICDSMEDVYFVGRKSTTQDFTRSVAEIDLEETYQI